MGAYPRRADAEAAKAALGADAKRLAGRSLVVAPATISGTAYYRLLVGGFRTPAEEVAFCARFKAAGRECFLRNVPAKAAAPARPPPGGR